MRVVVATDFLATEEAIAAALKTSEDAEIVGQASGGPQAVRMVRELRPDIVVMGTRLRAGSVIDTLREIMVEAPTPVVIAVCARDANSAAQWLQAIESGALALVAVPDMQNPRTAGSAARHFVNELYAMSQVRVVAQHRSRQGIATRSLVAGPPLPHGIPRIGIVAIAASTGGASALKTVLSGMPGDLRVPVLVVQHLCPGFDCGLAKMLDAEVPQKVKLAADGERLRAGHVYIAPDGSHLGVSGRTRIKLSNVPESCSFRPSATRLFESAAAGFGAETLAVILTGMGNDGVEGLRAVKAEGGTVIAQDQETSVVFGMPGEAVRAGLADLVLPVEKISSAITTMLQSKRAA